MVLLSIFTFIQMSTVSTFNRSSSCVSTVGTDIRRGEVRVVFNTGKRYLYKNVPQRSIQTLLTNPDISLGRWVNNHCVTPDSVICLQLN